MTQRGLASRVLDDLHAAGISTASIVLEAIRGVSAEASRWGGSLLLGVFALQSAVERSSLTLPYLGLAALGFLIADNLDSSWKRRVDSKDRAYYRRLRERLLDTLGRSTLADIGDPKRQSAMELHYNRAADISNLVETTAAAPGYVTRILLSGGALVAADWRIGLMVSLAVLPGFILKSRHTRRDLTLQESQMEPRKVVDRLEEEAYRPEGTMRMVLAGITAQVSRGISTILTRLDREKDHHERRQTDQVLLANLGYYGAMFGGFFMLYFQYRAGAIEVGTFAFLCHQLKELGEEVAAHGDTVQSFRALAVETKKFYEFVDTLPKQGTQPFPTRHRLTFVGAAYERGGFSVKLPDLTIEPGSLVVIHGASGAGKSTLLEHLAFGAPPSQGAVLVESSAIQELRFSEWRSRIGYCGARPALLEGRTLREVLECGDDEASFQERLRHPLIAGIVSSLERERGLDTRIGIGLPGGRGFSTGELHRIALVCALIPRPRLLFLDEVTSNQSDEFVTMVAEALDTLRARGTTILFATHSKRFDARASHLLRVSGGIAELQRTESLGSDGSHSGGELPRIA